jgi:PrgI family protein
MASYQIPQFLDSGDKIFLGMNLRQFAYAIVGFFICVGVFNIFYAAITNFAFVVIAPIAGFFAYLCLGKYNGRDTEVYIFKMIIYATKPRAMKYIRDYNLTETYAKMAKNTVTNIIAEMDSRVAVNTAAANDPLGDFDNQGSKTKANKIKQLGKNLDLQNANIGKDIIQREVKIQRHRELLTELEQDRLRTLELQKMQQIQKQNRQNSK